MEIHPFAMRSDLSEEIASTIVRVNYDVAETSAADDGWCNRADDVTGQEDEFTRAISLGLFDYVRKSRSGGFVVSMSGGADSSAVACLIRAMVELSVGEIGMHGVLDRWKHLSFISDVRTVDELMNELFLGVYQATINSSTTTLEAAREVTTGVGGRFYEL